MRQIHKILILMLFAFGTVQSQILIPDHQIKKYFSDLNQKSLPLEKAISILEQIYQVNFFYEANLLKGRQSHPLKHISKNFHKDLQHLIGNNPIQYLKVGSKTYVLFLKKAIYTNRRIIEGSVTNKQGIGIADAEIFIEGTPWGAAANKQGNYIIENVPVGKYSITARCIGYKTDYQEVMVHENETIQLDFSLEVDVLNMEEIVTTASRNPLTKIESSVAITTATNAQIDERSPRSTADLLKMIPGFYVESSGGQGGNNLFPRGIPQDGSYRYISMFEDGLPLFEAPELAFANIDILLRIDETIASMEGVRGGTGSIYASNAPGGIINFINKTGGDELEGVAKISVGDHSLYRFDFNYGGPIGNKWKFNLGGFIRYDDGIRSPEFVANKGGQIKANITRLFKNGYVRVYAKYLNDKNIFYLPIPLQNPDDPHPIPGFNANYGTMTSVYADNKRIPTPEGKAIEQKISNGINPELFSASTELMIDLGKGWSFYNATRAMKADIDFNAIFSLDNPFPAKFFADSVKELSTLPNFHHWEYRYADSQEKLTNVGNLNGNGLVTRNGLWHVDKPLRSITNHLQIKKKIQEHHLSISGYFSHYSADDSWYWHNILSEVKEAPRLLDLVAVNETGDIISSVTKNGFEQYGTFYVNSKGEADLFAVSLTDEWQFTNRLRFDLGVRFEQNVFNGRVENTRDNFVVNDGESPAERNVKYGDGTFRHYHHTFNEWAVSVGANFSVNRQFAVYGRASRGFRTPDFDHWIISTDKGNSQYVVQLESGAKLSYDQFSLFGTVFFSRLDNIPFVDEVVKDGQISKESRFAKSTTIGSEIEAIFTAYNNLRFHLIGTLQNPRLRDFAPTIINPETGGRMTVNLDGKRVRRIPQIILDFKPVYIFNPFKFYGTWQYIGERFVDDANTAKLSAYSVFNFGFSWEWFERGMTLSGNIINLTNSIGLTEGNPRVEQIFANRNDQVFMARPVLGRSIVLSATYKF